MSANDPKWTSAKLVSEPISAYDAFRAMRRLERDPSPEAREEWRRHHSFLCDELKLPPWQWPGVERPAAESLEDFDTPAQSLWRELERATKLQ
jgi:hypothetical protein